MSEPCTERNRLTELQIKQAEIAGDVAHIKVRIDNGMSHTISRIDATLSELKPVIEYHSSIAKRVEDAGWAMAYVFGGLMLCVIVWAVKTGMKL